MFRFLLFLLGIFFLFWLAFKWALRKLVNISFLKGMAPPPSLPSEKLIRCSLCHTFVPTSQAIKVGKDYYCCQVHADKANKNQE